MDTFHGLLCEAMTLQQIKETIRHFAEGARRAREAGLDGVELHASHGYLITQFLSSAINDRMDEYGGSLRNRAAFLLEIIQAIRKEVGTDYHLQAKLNAVDFGNALYPWEKKGNTIEEGIQVAKWAEEAGVDAIHTSIGSMFPHPLLPPGGFPPDELNWWYGSMISSGVRGYFNYTMFHFRLLRPIFSFFLGTHEEGSSGGGGELRVFQGNQEERQRSDYQYGRISGRPSDTASDLGRLYRRSVDCAAADRQSGPAADSGIGEGSAGQALFVLQSLFSERDRKSTGML